MSLSTFFKRSALALCAASFLASPATSLAESETVSIGESYSKTVYYNLNEGVVATHDLDAWDIAFELQGFTAAIRSNGGAGTLVYAVDGASFDDFATIDTTGMSASWTPLYNPETTWQSGAFNMGADPNTGNFGWGEYNFTTHTVEGKTVYVIVRPDGITRKFMVESLRGGVFYIRYASIDNTIDEELEIDKNDFFDKNFAYLSFKTDEVLDLEPVNYGWHLQFTKYIGFVGDNGDVPYGVTGVRSNYGLWTAQMNGVDPMTVDSKDAQYDSLINVIGHDWKYYDFNEGWVVLDDVVYFVQLGGVNLYRIYFTGFGGMGTGDIAFENSDSPISSVEIENLENAVSPVPAQAGESVRIKSTELANAGKVTIRVVSATGTQVSYSNNQVSNGEVVLSTAELASGAYFAVVELENGALYSVRFVVQ